MQEEQKQYEKKRQEDVLEKDVGLDEDKSNETELTLSMEECEGLALVTLAKTEK